MDLASILRDSEKRHHEFPITIKKVFLAHAAAGPLPHRTSSAIEDYVRRVSCLGQWQYLSGEVEKETRQYAARLLGAAEDEIALVASTSMGLSLVASGLTWTKGDNVVVVNGDFPANIYPWLNLGSQGVKTKFIPGKKDGAVTLEDVQNAVDEHTRLVSLSSVNYLTGYKIDINSIGEYLQQRGILFCLDAVQSAGVAPIDVRNVDFAAFSGHKWLLSPMGTGIFWLKRKHLDSLRPCLTGWKSVKSGHEYLSYNLDFLDSAQRYEPGSLNMLGLVGLHASLKLLLEIGIEKIAGRLAKLRQIIISPLREKGYQIVGPVEGRQSSGIITFTSSNQDIVALRRSLDENDFVVSLRKDLNGAPCIRVAPHFYNTEDEIGRFLEQLP